MSSEERVLAVPVRLALEDGGKRNGSLMLLGVPRSGPGSIETLLDLVNSPRRTVPFCPAGTDELELLTRTKIEWIAVGGDVEGRLVCPPGYACAGEQAVRMEFASGTVVEAAALGPPEAELRAPAAPGPAPEFLPFTTATGTLLANKSRIRDLHVLARAAGPLFEPAERSSPSQADGPRPVLAAPSLVQAMMKEGERALGAEGWSRVREAAAIAFARLAETIIAIQRQERPPGVAQARLQLETQKNSATLVLLGCEGVGFLAAARLLGGALQSIREKVNEALGFELVV